MRENKIKVPIIDDRPMTYKEFKAIMDRWDEEDRVSENNDSERQAGFKEIN